MKDEKLCLGYGPYLGKCTYLAGNPWSDDYCWRCNDLQNEAAIAIARMVTRGEPLPEKPETE